MACYWWSNEVEQLRNDQFFEFEQTDEVSSSFVQDLIQAAGSVTKPVDPDYEDEFYLHCGETEYCTNDGLQNNPTATLAELNGLLDDWDVPDSVFSGRHSHSSVNDKHAALNMLCSCQTKSDKHGSESCACTSSLSVSDIGSDAVLQSVKTPFSNFATVSRTNPDNYLTSERKIQDAVSSTDDTKGISYSPLLLTMKRQLFSNVEVKNEDVSQSAPRFAVSNIPHILEEESGFADEEPPCKKLKITTTGVY
jgi:hypothetical protein